MAKRRERHPKSAIRLDRRRGSGLAGPASTSVAIVEASLRPRLIVTRPKPRGAKRAEIIKLAGETHTPAIYCFRIFAVGGGLMSFAVDEMEQFRRAASFVDKLLRGAAPTELPVEEPSKFNE